MASAAAMTTPCLRSVRGAKACRNVVSRATERPLWYPGTKAPAWLDGTLPGDYGFDPLGLGSDPETLTYFVQAELVHARFAMLGVAGIAIPGLFTKLGLLNVPDWTVAGEVAIKDSGIPFWALAGAQLFLMGWAEIQRIQEYKTPGAFKDISFFGFSFPSGADGYPGGIFDPMGMSKGQDLKELQTKEIANGRLAMLAMVGFYSQHAATGKGPIDNLFDHLANPGVVNFATNGVSIPRPPAL